MARKDQDSLSEMRERYRRASEACAEAYDRARDDIRFVTVPGEQWDQKLKARRRGRPCYEFPKLQPIIRQVVNSMRQARPMGKVRGRDESDAGLAQIMDGLCMSIVSTSDADTAHDVAFESAVKGGMGVWRIATEYAERGSFEQIVKIKPIRNPLCVRFDPAAVEIDRSDGNFAFVEELVPRENFERDYPDADVKNFDASDARDWLDSGKVRVAEYWYKEPETRTLIALSNGDTVWEDETDAEALAASGITVLDDPAPREVKTHKVMMRLTNGAQWLTEPTEFPSIYIPIIPTWGQIDNIDGEDYWQGMTRWAKDQQRLHNVHRTAMIESVAKAPKAPFIVKTGWIKGLERFWKNANAEDYPFLPVNDSATGMPERSQPAAIPTALMQMAQLDDNDLEAATGIFGANLGSTGDSASGIAIKARQQQGNVSSYNFLANFSRAIRQEYKILIDMIPRVYDTRRIVRMLGQDGAERWVQLYQQVQDPQTGQMRTLNDISKGRYDVTVTVGPAFATQRQEAVQAFAQLVGQVGGSFPQLGELLSYMVVKNLDLPGNDEVRDSMRSVLVKQGLLPPDANDPPPQPPGPNPMQQAQMQKLQADAQLSMAKAQQAQAQTSVTVPIAQAEIGQKAAVAQHHGTDDALRVAAHVQSVMPTFQDKPHPPPVGGFDIPNT